LCESAVNDVGSAVSTAANRYGATHLRFRLRLGPELAFASRRVLVRRFGSVETASGPVPTRKLAAA
jgi:hypothetical protein